MAVNKEFIDRWERNQKGQPRSKRRRYIKLGLIIFVCLAVILVGFFLLSDFMARPNLELAVKANPGEWPMYGRDLAHSGVESLGTAVPQGLVTKILASYAAMHSSPVLANGVLYVGSQDGTLFAVQESTGQTLWTYKVSSWVDSTPAVVNNMVYFGSNDGYFYALNAHTGQKVWSYNVTYPIRSSPAVVDGKVYFGCEDYKVYCLRADTGKKVWVKATNGSVTSSPTMVNGVLFVGSADGNLYGIDARHGHQRLRIDTGKIVSCSPAVAGDTVYFVTTEANVIAANSKARNWWGEFVLRPPWQVLHVYGDLPAPPLPSGYLWSLASRGDFSIASPTLNGDHLYIGMSNKVVSINLGTHGKDWVTPVKGTISYAGVLSQNTVYATSSSGHLYLLDASSGALTKDIVVGGSITSCPLMVNGTIYISSDDGCLYQVK
jgi:eukaryotic-like serine/threonine-protein kinase